MLLATYIGITDGLQGFGNILIRKRLDSLYTHSELIFEPGEGVDSFLPDRNANPSLDGSLWAASSVFAEKLPNYSPVRAGEYGGVRFKRINIRTKNWVTIKLGFSREKKAEIAQWFRINQGAKYDYSLIANYAMWWLANDVSGRYMCSESIATAIGMIEPHRYHPALLHNTLQYIFQQ